MDFDFERAHKLGTLFLHRAAQTLGDPGILRVADFYKCYRAFVRGKIESLLIKSEEHAQRARRYFQLALRYATVGSEPLVLVVMGRIASGKSTVARRFARELHWPVFSSDAIRKTRGGSLKSRTAPELRGQIYSETMNEQTYRQLVDNGLAALATHGGVVLDATFSSRAKRDYLREECAKAHVRLRVIELAATEGEIVKRLQAREQNEQELSDARLEDLARLSAAYEAPSEFGMELIKVSTDISSSDSVKTALLRLAERRAS